MILKELVTVEEIDDGYKTIAHVDFDISEYDLFQLDVTLTNGYDIDDDIYIDYINVLNNISFINIESAPKEDIKKIISAIFSATNSIAINGFIGPGNVIFMSQDTYDLGFISYFEENKTFDVVLDDNIDGIILSRLNTIEQPGVVIVKNKTHYEIVKIGTKYEKQFAKIKLE